MANSKRRSNRVVRFLTGILVGVTLMVAVPGVVVKLYGQLRQPVLPTDTVSIPDVVPILDSQGKLLLDSEGNVLMYNQREAMTVSDRLLQEYGEALEQRYDSEHGMRRYEYAKARLFGRGTDVPSADQVRIRDEKWFDPPISESDPRNFISKVAPEKLPAAITERRLPYGQ